MFCLPTKELVGWDGERNGEESALVKSLRKKKKKTVKTYFCLWLGDVGDELRTGLADAGKSLTPIALFLASAGAWPLQPATLSFRNVSNARNQNTRICLRDLCFVLNCNSTRIELVNRTSTRWLVR